MTRTKTIYLALLAVLLSPMAANADVLIEDFESGLTGFFTFGDGGTVGISTTTDAPAGSVPGASIDNSVLQVEVGASVGFGGLAHDFTATSDWSAYNALSFWLYGYGSDNNLFIDVREDDGGELNCCGAEIWSYRLTDSVAGWTLVEIPFSAFAWKAGASNDGFALTEVRGWAFGYEFGTDATIYYLDDIRLVPEPGTLALLAIGIFGLGLSRRRTIRRHLSSCICLENLQS